jgi:hypothetical protein
MRRHENTPAGITRHMSSRAVVCASKEVHACPWSRSGLAAERPRSPSVSAPHRESLARPTGPGLLTYLIVPKVPKVPKALGSTSPFACKFARNRLRLGFRGSRSRAEASPPRLDSARRKQATTSQIMAHASRFRTLKLELAPRVSE